MTLTAKQAKAPPADLTADWGIRTLYNLSMTAQTCLSGISAYSTNFLVPYILSTIYFQKVESQKIFTSSPTDTIRAYMDLLDFNFELINQSISSALDILGTYGQNEAQRFLHALIESVKKSDSRFLDEYADQRLKLMEDVVYGYPQAIENIESEYGFHFERDGHKLITETDRFLLYQVAPSQKAITPQSSAKPILIIPPYVLGANILCFLPKENRSYVHSYANQGIPTYIRILKKIDSTPALQVMTAENDALDTRYMCETIYKRHGKPVTLNGYCQGGFNALCNLLSGELDELVDAFITCVAPMDGTRSKGLAHFLNRLPQRFNDLAYGTKTLPNGNEVADGKLMGWIYRIKSIATEHPLASFYNDMKLVSTTSSRNFKFTKMAAALNYWLINERSDLPMEITKMSYMSYTRPITKDGILPVTLFDRKLDLHRIKEKKIPWLICYGVHDNLVEPDTALAPLDYIQAEVSPFPKGHVAIATSWSEPRSACSLDGRFGEGNWRGPVRFHLDLDERTDAVRTASSQSVKLEAKDHPRASQKKSPPQGSKISDGKAASIEKVDDTKETAKQASLSENNALTGPKGSQATRADGSSDRMPASSSHISQSAIDQSDSVVRTRTKLPQKEMTTSFNQKPTAAAVEPRKRKKRNHKKPKSTAKFKPEKPSD